MLERDATNVNGTNKEEVLKLKLLPSPVFKSKGRGWIGQRKDFRLNWIKGLQLNSRNMKEDRRQQQL